MKFMQLRWLALVGVLVLALANNGQAQGRRDASDSRHDNERDTFRGLINDHTVATAGSWEVNGTWKLELKQRGSKADFLAELTMERADYWFLTNLNPPADPNSLTARNAHTHHIGVTDGIVTALANGFRVSGAATLTGNGATPPFGTTSTVQLDVTGGDLVTYSNISMTFGGDAIKHFGPNPLAGVVFVRTK